MKNKRLYVEGFEAKVFWTELAGAELELYNVPDLYIAIKSTDTSDFIMIDFDFINEDGESDLGESGEPNIIMFRKEK